MLSTSGMNKLELKYIPLSLLVYGLLIFSGKTMIESFISGVTWKITFSTIGFTIFLGFAVINTKGILTKISAGDK